MIHISSADVLGLAVRIAGVIDEHRRAEAVDHVAVSGAEQVRDKAVLVALICLILGEAWPVILESPCFPYECAASCSSRQHGWTKSESSGQGSSRTHSECVDFEAEEHASGGAKKVFFYKPAMLNITNLRAQASNRRDA